MGALDRGRERGIGRPVGDLQSPNLGVDRVQEHLDLLPAPASWEQIAMSAVARTHLAGLRLDRAYLAAQARQAGPAVRCSPPRCTASPNWIKQMGRGLPGL